MKSKNLVILSILFLLGTSCANKQNSNVSSAYIVDDSTITVINKGEEDVDIPVYPGGYTKVTVVNSRKISAKSVAQSFSLGLIKPGLDLSIFSGCWGVPGNMIGKRDAMHNAVYIEKMGVIHSVQNLYVANGSITQYMIINSILIAKKLTATETYDLPQKIRSKIDKGEIFIIEER